MIFHSAMKKLCVVFLVFASACVVSIHAWADIDVYSFTSDEKLASYQALTKELRCPKCQNQDIKDSNAPIASDMRREVHRLIEDGQSHEQIIAFMNDRFGEFVTYKPKVSKETYLLWYGPWLFIAVGAIFIVFAVGKKGKKSKERKGGSESVGEQLASQIQQPESSKAGKVEDLLAQYDNSDKG